MWEDNILPIGVAAVTEAKTWHCSDAQGAGRSLSARPSSSSARGQGTPGTLSNDARKLIESSHSYLLAVAEREGFILPPWGAICINGARLGHWAKTDLNYGGGDLRAITGRSRGEADRLRCSGRLTGVDRGAAGGRHP